MLVYYTEVKNYYDDSYMESNCNAITFLNVGTNTVNVNGIDLQQSQSFIVGGNRGEIDSTQYYVQFTGAGSNNLAVIRKLYVGVE